MSTIDGQALFASGPHAFTVGSVEQQVIRRSAAGLDGEMVIDLGRRGRVIRQTGRLQAATVGELQAAFDQLHTFVDGHLHTLVDANGREFAGVLMEAIAPAGPVQHGRGYWCDYEIVYRQVAT
jgi:hypothetical protein